MISTSDSAAGRIDATGLPLIGMGILLSGLPDQLMQFLAVSITLLVFTGVVLILTFRRRHGLAWSDVASETA